MRLELKKFEKHCYNKFNSSYKPVTSVQKFNKNSNESFVILLIPLKTLHFWASILLFHHNSLCFPLKIHSLSQVWEFKLMNTTSIKNIFIFLILNGKISMTLLIFEMSLYVKLEISSHNAVLFPLLFSLRWNYICESNEICLVWMKFIFYVIYCMEIHLCAEMAMIVLIGYFQC